MSLTHELFLAGMILAALILYALSGGADYGGGMWDLLASGPRARRQREMISKAIGPIWEANHVWLIVVIVLMFVAFPRSFGVVMTSLFIPMTVILVGIVLRGSTFIFRAYDSQEDDTHRRWSTIFGVASFLTPFLLGLSLGALGSGEIRAENGLVRTGLYAGWTSPFAIGCGLFAQGLFAFLAAVYLAADAHDEPELESDFRLRAIFSEISLAPAAGLVFLLARNGAPELFAGLTRWWAPWLLAATSVCALGALAALWFRRFNWARVAAAGQVSLILLGWGLAHFPWIVIPDITFADTAAPDATLRLVSWTLGVGMVFLLPAFGYLYYIFKSKGVGES